MGSRGDAGRWGRQGGEGKRLKVKGKRNKFNLSPFPLTPFPMPCLANAHRHQTRGTRQMGRGG
ncbi:hypothetical protein VF04_09455 [Nostoc linckia z7]|uniref:Uncharacterized protein n=2 Tax=Nostoc linckia TaxID=92942 RepID=A0A9Q6EM48_NOSLI|nr:hypothetical protein VF02_08245 [Nostoc linckia z1]PHJ71601.1 hypothetical protein VF05_06115 [Nostoc linckia z3]PHJ86806.1 hypothetical protein VF06_00225 [Nostoc linckia z4]PHJ98363.1 hypothetical protein VF04_09455 [Nostoc linckia z7]PHK04730.1 hypothetical protein VF08_10130 [Nostoc linckia z8]PHK09377.1 hypothetical protein VF09_15665 [Nostoc linckia z9]PHK17905.1 hypothetical protein VF11_20485 [Nostoc linckia z14]PHK24241.1 hypothetical protein VF10_12995 [Nostoc linckia z13]PHK28